MNRSQRLIFKSNAQPLFKPQHRPECSMKHKNDMIGPPDPISNLRPIKYAVREDETSAEKELRIQREELQAWNTSFWTKNNLNFINKKKEFLSSELNKNSSKKESLSADEVSVFYKDFLDKNWNLHKKYLIECLLEGSYAMPFHELYFLLWRLSHASQLINILIMTILSFTASLRFRGSPTVVLLGN